MNSTHVELKSYSPWSVVAERSVATIFVILIWHHEDSCFARKDLLLADLMMKISFLVAFRGHFCRASCFIFLVTWNLCSKGNLSSGCDCFFEAVRFRVPGTLPRSNSIGKGTRCSTRYPKLNSLFFRFSWRTRLNYFLGENICQNQSEKSSSLCCFASKLYFFSSHTTTCWCWMTKCESVKSGIFLSERCSESTLAAGSG